jgi:hypothetical protein
MNSCPGSVAKGNPARYLKISVEGKTADSVRGVKTVRKNKSQSVSGVSLRAF